MNSLPTSLTHSDLISTAENLNKRPLKSIKAQHLKGFIINIKINTEEETVSGTVGDMYSHKEHFSR